MKETIYKCDCGCGRTITHDKAILSIWSGPEGISIRNNLGGRKLMEMDNHGELNFFSKPCLASFLFHTKPLQSIKDKIVQEYNYENFDDFMKHEFSEGLVGKIVLRIINESYTHQVYID